jgi:tetratricopeptide (TPR) repeat protein
VLRFSTLGIALLATFAVSLGLAPAASAQVSLADQLQIGPPVRRAEPPSPNASATDLEHRGDQLRAEKAFLDALDYYRAALAKSPNNALIYNKMGITELLMTRYRAARKDFERAVRADRKYADAYNNLGVIHYLQKSYVKAVKLYQKAIEFRGDSASFYSNLGTAHFAKKDYASAMAAYSRAMELDPDVFERSSHSGVSAQMSSPEDRAYYDYLLAKMYAKMGLADRSLQYLRRSMEEGYKNIEQVYKDNEFAELRKDPRFASLMTTRPLAIPE